MLLLHGYPETHAMWHKVAPALARDYTVVCPDLRGYGDSSKPRGLPDHSNYSKRSMAKDMVEVMSALGHRSFHLVGHDRGARVAHRLARDHGSRVRTLTVLDISPTLKMYGSTDKAFATAYYHWFFLIQKPPLPEQLLAGHVPRLYPRAASGAARAASGISPSRRSASTSAVSATRAPSTPPARTIAPRPPSTSSTTAGIGTRSSGCRCRCCGESRA